LARVDLGGGRPGAAEAAFGPAAAGAGRREHNVGDRQRLGPAERRRVAGAVVGEAPRGAAGMDGDVEAVLGDPGAGARCCGRVPYTPQTNGMAERFNGRIEREVLTITVGSHRDLERLLKGYNQPTPPGRGAC
jgi:hypothetical protein